jgi:hypothetical protein
MFIRKDQVFYIFIEITTSYRWNPLDYLKNDILGHIFIIELRKIHKFYITTFLLNKSSSCIQYI